MIKLIVFSVLFNVNDSNIVVMPPDPVKVEAGRKRGKGKRGKRRGGNGLR